MVVGVNATSPPLYPRERPGTRFIGGWVEHWAGLDGCGKPRPHRDSIPRLSSLYRVAITLYNIRNYMWHTHLSAVLFRPNSKETRKEFSLGKFCKSVFTFSDFERASPGQSLQTEGSRVLLGLIRNTAKSEY